MAVKTRKEQIVEQNEVTTTSGLAKYPWKKHLRTDWMLTKIIHNKEHWYKRNLKESAYITINNILNDSSVQIREEWKNYYRSTK